MQTVTLTREMLNGARTKLGGYTRAQVGCLGLLWPPTAGWLRSLRGKTVSKETWDRFVALGKIKPTRNSTLRKLKERFPDSDGPSLFPS